MVTEHSDRNKNNPSSNALGDNRLKKYSQGKQFKLSATSRPFRIFKHHILEPIFLYSCIVCIFN